MAKIDKYDTMFLNGIRFILALWVAVGHFYKSVGAMAFIKIPLISTILLTNGAAVDGFMVITGFLMTYNYILRQNKEHPNKLSTFYKFWVRRFFRLYPVYFLAIIVAFTLYKFNSQWTYENYYFFSGTRGGYSSTYALNNPADLSNLFYHLTFLHGLIPLVNTGILGPAWSLSLEIQYYILFPLIFLLLINNTSSTFNYKLIIAMIISIALALLSINYFGEWQMHGKLLDYDAPSLITYKLPLFILGMVMAGVLLKTIKPVFLIICLAMVIPFPNAIVATLVVFIVYMMFFKDISFLAGWIKAPSELLKRIFSGKAASIGADISYSFYLIQMIIMPGALKLSSFVFPSNKFLSGFLGLMACLLITGSISYILYLVIEKPFITIGKKLISDK